MFLADNKTSFVKKVDSGSSAEILCDSFGETSWYFKREDKYEHIPFHEKTLTLKFVTPDNAGVYICHGTYRWRILEGRFFQQTHLKVFSKFFLN